jgi:nitroimidazol reductase NimA-like FMN-containing flavoprotein (pyridoxamine 5'-phosphate oxidase superfamily)
MTRLPRKSSHDRAELYALLDSVSVVQVGLVVEDHPVVFPTAGVRDQGSLLVHGSTGSRWMRHLASGARACVSVTRVDAVVVARSLFESSYRYRSAAAFGTFSVLEGESKVRGLHRLADHLIPGRAEEVRDHSPQELAATIVLSLPLTHWSLRISSDGPYDSAEDCKSDVWAGVVPMTTVLGEPVPDPDLRTDIPVPNSVTRLANTFAASRDRAAGGPPRA